MNNLPGRQKFWVVLAAILYVGAGLLHFLKPDAYARTIPPHLPWPRVLVFASGLFEILGGAGLLVNGLRREAAWGLVGLLVAVFPANVYMAAQPAAAGLAEVPPVFLWLRLPIQFVFIWWLLRCTKTGAASAVNR